MGVGRIAIGTLGALVVLLLAGCSQKSILVLTDPYWTLELGAEDGISRLSSAAGKLGYSLDVKSVDPAGSVERQLTAQLLGSTAATIILSPLLSQGASQLAELHPHRRFIAFGSDAGRLPSNLTVLVSDPRDAFFRAGVEVGKFVAALSARRGVQLSGCGLFSVATEARRDSMRGFVEGFASVTNAPFFPFEVREPADRNAVRIFLNDMKLKNPGIYVIAAPSVAGYCLELLKEDPAALAVENWPPQLSGDSRIAVSIDEESLSALVKIVETLGRSTDNRMRIPWRVVVPNDQAH